ncbi:unnamed protein product, partial [Brassica oleracea var. botrytis]
GRTACPQPALNALHNECHPDVKKEICSHETLFQSTAFMICIFNLLSQTYQ